MKKLLILSLFTSLGFASNLNIDSFSGYKFVTDTEDQFIQFNVDGTATGLIKGRYGNRFITIKDTYWFFEIKYSQPRIILYFDSNGECELEVSTKGSFLWFEYFRGNKCDLDDVLFVRKYKL